MGYSQHRANIRSAMCTLTLSEALAFQADLRDRNDTEGAEYADEWIEELREEIADCIDPSECSGDEFCGACTD